MNAWCRSRVPLTALSSEGKEGETEAAWVLPVAIGEEGCRPIYGLDGVRLPCARRRDTEPCELEFR
jgi:hypothetical protein